jgi:hypothetical protein
MKQLFFITLLGLCSSVSMAEDLCKKITRDTTDNTIFTLTAPTDTGLFPPIKISRNYSIDADAPYDHFVIVLQISSNLAAFIEKNKGIQADYESNKFALVFDDQTKIEEDTISISYDVNNDEQVVVRTMYLPIDENSIKTFVTKKITRFVIGDKERMITPEMAAVYQAYISCIYSAKKF